MDVEAAVALAEQVQMVQMLEDQEVPLLAHRLQVHQFQEQAEAEEDLILDKVEALVAAVELEVLLLETHQMKQVQVVAAEAETAKDQAEEMVVQV